jgi:hypothetical protein
MAQITGGMAAGGALLGGGVGHLVSERPVLGAAIGGGVGGVVGYLGALLEAVRRYGM